MVISPFVGAPAIERLASEVRAEFSVIGRFDELAKLDAATIDRLDGRRVRRRVLAPRRRRRATAVTRPEIRIARNSLACTPRCSSENATDAPPSTSDRPTRPRLHSSATSSSLLNSTAGAPTTARRLSVPCCRTRTCSRRSSPAPSRQPKIRPRLCSGHWSGSLTNSRPGALRARVEPAGEDRWRTVLLATRTVDLGGTQVCTRARCPSTRRSPSTSAPTRPRRSLPTGLSSVTPFFALGLLRASTAAASSTSMRPSAAFGGRSWRASRGGHGRAALRHRSPAALSSCCCSRTTATATACSPSSKPCSPSRTVGGSAGADGGGGGLPLLEPMLRALHRAPERLEEIDRLLADMRTAGAVDRPPAPA